MFRRYPLCRMGVATAADVSLPFYAFQGGPKSVVGESTRFFARLQDAIRKVRSASSLTEANNLYGIEVATAQAKVSEGTLGPSDLAYFTATLRPYFDAAVAALLGAPLAAAQAAAAAAETARIEAEKARSAAETARETAEKTAQAATEAATAAEQARLDAEARAADAEARVAESDAARLEAVAQAEADRAARAAAEAQAAQAQAEAAAVRSDAELAARASIARQKKMGKFLLVGAAATIGGGGILLLSGLR